jgi:di/tricarboxylate transporter
MIPSFPMKKIDIDPAHVIAVGAILLPALAVTLASQPAFSGTAWGGFGILVVATLGLACKESVLPTVNATATLDAAAKDPK